ncbi:putative mitochondrion protein [Basidiobolus meristosporus CBS 931.73]|uniref:Putative mitochondrion protein n=1 Tax=Basidiobolus meristosporus CBS 931.73 TaxID=1314790 RepID=A0A1Y1YFJ5_9FUNG|nr:putative mitochondrion protein [Basidiobolus meristosporus CBS 931.73]|eukprot:ORX96476.1 putative mitochondrion protein [Basidiobolus meristosporus CBS 931.73]
MAFLRKLAKPSAFLVGTGASLYFFDSQFNSKTFQRNMRTLWAGGMIIADYKLNFRPDKALEIDALHTRVAKRILTVCQKNGGLYIKFGQVIATQAAVLPPQYNRTFKVLYDDAPSVPYEDVVHIFQEDFGCHPDDMFVEFERKAFASASIAQVHRARLRDGTLVAVKVQKPYIRDQLDWDLRAYKAVCWLFEKAFDLPVYWSTEYTEKHLRQEVDFINEGHNAEKAAENLATDSNLSSQVYIPKVFWKQTSSRILTAEWIDGIPLSETDKVEQCGFSTKAILETVIGIFAHQIFMSGFVHCDPHPGNILIRKHPTSNKPQVVLLDHGLYVTESDQFRADYCRLWKSLFLMDSKALEKICHGWGIRDVNMFASATLLRPYNGKQAVHMTAKPTTRDVYEMQLQLKERAKEFLSNTELIPRELIFIGRNMNIVRANNKVFGSPVNRINMMANYAVKGLGADWSQWYGEDGLMRDPHASTARIWYRHLVTAIRGRVSYWTFQLALLAISATYYASQLWRTINKAIFGRDTGSFEDVLDNQVRAAVANEFGVVLDENAFDA